MASRDSLQKDLKIFISITSLVLLLELTGGIFTNSLALISDSAHVFVDLLALSLTYFSFQISKRAISKEYTFGYFRAEIIAAIINGVILVLISIFIFYESYMRIFSPQQIKVKEMIVISIAGFLANLYIILKMRKSHENLNAKGAYLHVLSDTISSIGVILAALLIIATGNYVFDALISAVIGIFVLTNSIGLLKESVHVIMEGTPKNIDLIMLSSDMEKIEGVNEVHDLHVWSIASDIFYLSSHILIDAKNIRSAKKIIGNVNKMLKSKYKITHSVIQLECDNCINLIKMNN